MTGKLATRHPRACGLVGDLLSKIFPPVDRSGQCDSKGRVISRKLRRRKSHLITFPTAEVV